MTNVICDESVVKTNFDVTKRDVKIVYISGPYTLGDVAKNVRDACRAGDAVFDMGLIPLVPHLTHLWHLISPKSHHDWMEIDLNLIPRCDAILRLPGESKGADVEVAVAQKLGIPVFYSLQELRDFVEKITG